MIKQKRTDIPGVMGILWLENYLLIYKTKRKFEWRKKNLSGFFVETNKVCHPSTDGP